MSLLPGQVQSAVSDSITPLHFRYDFGDGLPSNNIYRIAEDCLGRIWIGHDNGISYFNGQNFKNIPCNHLDDSYIVMVRMGYDDHCYFRNFHGQFGYVDLDTVHLLKLPANIQSVFDFYFDENKMYLHAIDTLKRNVFYEVSHSNKGDLVIVEEILSLAPIYAITDYSFVVGDSLIYLRSAAHKMSSVKGSNQVQKESYTNKNPPVRLFNAEDEDVIVYAESNTVEVHQSIGHLYRSHVFDDDVKSAIYSTKNGIIASLKNGGVAIKNGQSEKQYLSNIKDINIIYEDKEHRLWIGTKSHGLICVPDFEVKEQKIDDFGKTEDPWQKSINSSFEIKSKVENDTLILRISGRDVVVASDISVKQHIIDNDLLHICSNWGYLVVPVQEAIEHGVSQGLCLICERTHSFTIHADSTFTCHKKGISLIVDKEVARIARLEEIAAKKIEYINGRLVVLTMTGSILIYDIKADSLQEFSGIQDIKLLTRFKKDILIADQGHIYWLNDAHDEFMIHPASSFLAKNSAVQDINLKGERMLIETNDKLLYVPESVLSNIERPVFKIKRVSSGKRDYKAFSDLIKLKRNQKICIEIEQINFLTNRDNFYYYLESLRRNSTPPSIRTQSDEQICFADLAPNTYRFSVSPFKNMESKQVLEFRIIPFFYERWPFYLFSSFALILVSIIVFNRMQKRKNERLKEKLEQKSTLNVLKFRLLRNQLNPHYLYNLLTSLKSRIIEENTGQALSMMNLLIRHLRSFFSYSNLSEISVAEELKFIDSYIELESTKRINKIEFEKEIIKLSEDDQNSIKIPTMILQPLIENCIKHSNSNELETIKIQLIISKKIDELLIKIKNTPAPDEAGLSKYNKKKEQSSMSLLEKSLSLYNGENTSIRRGINPEKKAEYIVEFKIKVK